MRASARCGRSGAVGRLVWLGKKPKDHKKSREVGEFFDKHIRSKHTLDDIKALDALLPTDTEMLHELAKRCAEESRKAMRAGHHTESRRFEILGRQLQGRVERESS